MSITYAINTVGYTTDTNEEVFRAFVYRNDEFVWHGTRTLEYGEALKQARSMKIELEREEEIYDEV